MTDGLNGHGTGTMNVFNKKITQAGLEICPVLCYNLIAPGKEGETRGSATYG